MPKRWTDEAERWNATATALRRHLSSWTSTYSVTASTCGTCTYDITGITNALTAATLSATTTGANFSGTDRWLRFGNPYTLATDASIWTSWVEEDDARITRRAISEEQRAAWREQERVQREQIAAADAVRKQAREKARALLLSCLTPEQREDLTRKKCFYINVAGGRRFRIDEGTHGNVHLLDAKGSIIGRYCIQPHGVPTEDAMLAQKLWLETNPDQFGKIANFTPLRTLTDDDKRLILPSRRAA